MSVTLNEAIPNFSAPMTGDSTFELKAYQGQKIVLYFYPKDNTPGCTNESIDFTEHFNEFVTRNTVVFGISKDSLRKHENFKAKYAMPFDLISDEDENLCTLFDVLKEKSMFGKKYMGIERSTFIIDENGQLVAEWRKVKVPGHVIEVLETLKTL